jgi:hypothetical protein
MMNPIKSVRTKWQHKTKAKRTIIKLMVLIEVMSFFFLVLGYKQIYQEWLSLVTQPTVYAQIEKPVVYDELPQTVKDTLKYFSNLYGVNLGLVEKIVQCESGGSPDRIGFEAKVPLNSIGLFQFQPATWVQYSALYKVRNANIYDYRDQTLVAVMMLRDGKCNLWSCCPNKK